MLTGLNRLTYFMGSVAACWLAIAVTATVYADTGIIVALDSSLGDFLKVAHINGMITKADRKFYSGTLGGEKIVLVRSPMGKVNNAITAQILISQFPMDRVYSISPAGALTEGLEVGDIVVANTTYQHDFGTAKPYGFIWGMVPVPSERNEAYNVLDASLIKTILEAGKSLKNRNKMMAGILVSGDQFIASASKKKWLQAKFNAGAVDMGGAAIAQVCYSNNVRCCLIRVITDQAEIEARTDFAESVAASRSDIDLPRIMADILSNRIVTGTEQ
jgi:adenosylhomocysteine nucleosidase